MRLPRSAPRPEQRGQHAPDLWSVWVAAPIIVVLGAAAAFGVFRWLDARAVPVEVPGGRPRVDTLDVIKTTLTVLAFVGALLAGLYAYRKQRLAEGDAARADAQQFADRYTKALDQLGSEQAAIRLGGVYAMARLADDWKTQRQTCIDVLCAYLRMPYQPAETPGHRPGENEVRRTIMRVIVDHLREGSTNPSWSTQWLDFTGAHLDDADFSWTTLSGFVAFEGATFSGDTRFSAAAFSRDANFNRTTFSGNANFDRTTFFGDANFDRTTFSGTVRFSGATFSGVARFTGVTFSGAWFDDAIFSDTAWFDDATFSDDAKFGRTTFSADARFGEARFSADAGFGWATFSRDAAFQGTTFASGAWFGGATFSGEAKFHRATFSGDANFDKAGVSPRSTGALANARFRGGVVPGPFNSPKRS